LAKITQNYPQLKTYGAFTFVQFFHDHTEEPTKIIIIIIIYLSRTQNHIKCMKNNYGRCDNAEIQHWQPLLK